MTCLWFRLTLWNGIICQIIFCLDTGVIALDKVLQVTLNICHIHLAHKIAAQCDIIFRIDTDNGFFVEGNQIFRIQRVRRSRSCRNNIALVEFQLYRTGFIVGGCVAIARK